jgi:ABC-2 type transport system ATP-binding protein
LTMYSIEVRGLKKNYSGENALSGADFRVRKGGLFGLIGADGAGKTTLLRILATLIDADSGEARVLSCDVKEGLSEIRSRIGYMPQRFSLYEDLSVEENMLFFADVFCVPAWERGGRMERLLKFSRLAAFRDRRAGRLSGGMKQKLALSCALIHTPELLILDEPTTGVDPLSRREFWSILKELNQSGVTILASTPYLDEAAFCDEIALFHQGRVLLAGSPDDLLRSPPGFSSIKDLFYFHLTGGKG